MYFPKLTTLYRFEKLDLCRANYNAALALMAYGDIMKIKPHDLRFRNMMRYNKSTKLFCYIYELPAVAKAHVQVPHAWTINTLRQNLTKICTLPKKR